MPTDFRTRLKRGERLLGTMVTLACPATAEILADIGFDWLFVDGEHGPLETGDMRTLHMPDVSSMAIVVDGPENYRRVTHELIREGVDIVKLVISGDTFVPHAPSHATVMSEAEVAAAAEVVHAHGKRMSAHARSAGAVKLAVKYGVRMVYHANFADEEALDMLQTGFMRVQLSKFKTGSPPRAISNGRPRRSCTIK